MKAVIYEIVNAAATLSVIGGVLVLCLGMKG